MVNFSLKPDIICIGIYLFIRDGNMAILKSNVCNMCGGLLDIDIDRQVYICPFCGVTFDYEYFRKDNVLDIAKKSISRQEFGAAKDAFDYMLKKDPHNFEALRGLILCRCKWTSLRPMLNEKEVFLQSNDPALMNAIEKCEPVHKDYFNTIKESLDVLHSYRKGRAELAKLSDDLSVKRNTLIDLARAQAANRTRFTQGFSDLFDSMIMDDGRSFIPILVIGSLFILYGLGYATFANRQYWIPVVVFAILALIIVIYNVQKAFTNKAIEAAKKPVKDAIDVLNVKIDELNKENNELIRTYNTMAAKIVNTYPIAEVEEVTAEGDTDSNPKESKKSSGFPSPSRMS